MSSNPTFTIEQLQEFLELSKRFAQTENRKQEIASNIAKLERQKKQVDEESAEMERKLNGEFAELAKVAHLFSESSAAEKTEKISDSPAADSTEKICDSPGSDSTLTIEETNYVTKDKKELLLKKIMSDFRRSNPNRGAISYTEVKDTLEKTYNIKTRSIANFFLGILSDYETVGGHRNKKIVLPKE